jgi:hypothetical protein
LSKISYLGSVSCALAAAGMDISLALSGGSRTAAIPGMPFEIAGPAAAFLGEYNLLVCRYSSHSLEGSAPFTWLRTIPTIPFIELADAKTTVTTDLAVSGFNTKIGAGASIEGVFEANAVFGMDIGISGKRKQKTVSSFLDTGLQINMLSDTVNEYDYYRDGSAISAGLKARYFFGSLLVIGAAFDLMDLNVKRINNEGDDAINENLNLIGVLGGATVNIGSKLRVPVEAVYRSGTRTEKEPVGEDAWYWTAGMAGIKTGVEYLLTDEITVRGGFDYFTGAATYKRIDTGTGTTVAESDPVGEAGNPSDSKIGIGAGAGYKLGDMDINASFKYTINGENTLEDGYFSKTSSDMQINASLLINL